MTPRPSTVNRRFIVRHDAHVEYVPEIVRDLYAAAAPAWAEGGAMLHFALVPVPDELLEPWYRLAFGQVQLEAIRESGSKLGPLPAGVSIRRAGIDDLDTAAMPLAKLIWEHQALGTTATIPEVRGTGIGLRLSERVLSWAREAGYPTIVTDWRVANLLASRFWPARGFRPTFVRVYRRLGVG